jgi:hypothetical protein
MEILWKEVIEEYKKKDSSFDNIIKMMKEKEESINKYIIDDGLLYYRIDEYNPWRLYLSDIPFHEIMIHDNHNLMIIGYPDYIKIYSKITRIYY